MHLPTTGPSLSIVGVHRRWAGSDIDCDILANLSHSTDGAAIDLIDVVSGALGTETMPNEAEDYPIIGTAGSDKVSITQITAKKAVRAHIVAKQGIGLIRTTGVVDGGAITQGGMKGTVEVNTLNPQSLTQGGLFDIVGNFEAAMTITDGLPADATIKAGRWFGDEPGSGTQDCSPFLTLQEAGRLAGQIIIGANGNATTGVWYRPVLVDGTTDYTLGPDTGIGCTGSSVTGRAYEIPSSTLGGGAIGVVPFLLYNVDCAPPNPAQDNTTLHYPLDYPGGVLQTRFNQSLSGGEVKLTFYGPVRTDATTDSPVKIEHVVAPGETNGAVDVTAKCQVTLKRAGATGTSREIVIQGAVTPNEPPQFFAPGIYRVKPVLSGTNKLYCDVGTSTKTPVADFTYWFSIRWDCNHNGTEDFTDIADEVSEDTTPRDGYPDECEGGAYTIGCVADYDWNGFANGDDLDFFYLDFLAGSWWADIDGNTFVNADDYDLFVALFGEGC